MMNLTKKLIAIYNSKWSTYALRAYLIWSIIADTTLLLALMFGTYWYFFW